MDQAFFFRSWAEPAATVTNVNTLTLAFCHERTSTGSLPQIVKQSTQQKKSAREAFRGLTRVVVRPSVLAGGLCGPIYYIGGV